jgi:hypothetical protein
LISAGFVIKRWLPAQGSSFFRSLSDLLMNIVSSAGIFIAMTGICLDRLLKQRSALQKLDIPFDVPPLRGGLRSLSVGADCLATESRALSALLS